MTNLLERSMVMLPLSRCGFPEHAIRTEQFPEGVRTALAAR
ncbi:MAG: hypothetical protein N3D18_08590 [Roseococcus sp.]|nr:hypothetical protein [Roseococcus sp.]